MKLKVGDKVKFLNESGGGIIKAIIDSKLVKLETDDGFEMPVLTTELIKDFRAEQDNEQTVYRPQTALQPQVQTEEPEENRITGINPWGKIREEKGVYLAFEPHERQWVLTGDLDVVIINHTSYDILYNLFFVRDNEVKGIDYGSIPFESKIVIDTIGRDDIEDWTRGFIQLAFHSDEPEKIFLPAHSVIDIKPSRFFKEGSYQPSTLISGRTILISVAPESTLEVASFSEAHQKTGRQSVASPASPVREKQLIDKHRKTQGEAVVDLHIAELMDNIAGLSSHDMFTIQLDYFRKALRSAIKNEYHKVTFIHGIGNGVLKNAIVEELENYEGIENKMASISKFGVGALDVMIKSKDD